MFLLEIHTDLVCPVYIACVLVMFVVAIVFRSSFWLHILFSVVCNGEIVYNITDHKEMTRWNII